VKTIGLLGLDGQNAPDGRLWHHMPHPEAWGTNPKRYQYHGEALAALVGPLSDAGVVALNLNRSSAHTMFPFTDLDELL
jgi:hypothetical protein